MDRRIRHQIAPTQPTHPNTQIGEMRNYDCDDAHTLKHPDSAYDPYRDKNCEKSGPAKETYVLVISSCWFWF